MKYSGKSDSIKVSGSEFFKFDDDKGDYYYIISDLVMYDRKSGRVVYLPMGWDVGIKDDDTYGVEEDFEWFIYPLED